MPNFTFAPPSMPSQPVATKKSSRKSPHQVRQELEEEEPSDTVPKNFNFVFSPPAKTPASVKLKAEAETDFQGWIKAQQQRESQMGARMDSLKQFSFATPSSPAAAELPLKKRPTATVTASGGICL